MPVNWKDCIDLKVSIDLICCLNRNPASVRMYKPAECLMIELKLT